MVVRYVASVAICSDMTSVYLIQNEMHVPISKKRILFTIKATRIKYVGSQNERFIDLRSDNSNKNIRNFCCVIVSKF